MIHRAVQVLFLLCLLAGLGCSADTGETIPDPETVVEETLEPEASPPWWEMSDEEFAETYAPEAFSDDIQEQSQVAWMIFARINEQVPNPFGSSPATVSKWETWPNDEDTFSSGGLNAAKTRDKPRFVTRKKALAASALTGGSPPSGGEEVTRNDLGYDYIRDNNLYTFAGIAQQMNDDFVVDLPIGAIEIKGNWSNGAISGAYTYRGSGGTFSLIGLHIGMKMEPTPPEPFTSEEPSWFWTTFEFKDNPTRPDLEPFVTYKDQLTQAEADQLLAAAGLGGTDFVNYRSNGTQIQFSDATHSNIVLGNSTMEGFAAVPASGPPYTAWDSSCHNCHGQVAMNRFDGFIPTNFAVETGPITNRTMEDWYPLDFVWGFFNAQ